MMKNSKDLLGSVVKTAQMGKTGLECVLQAPLRPSLRENLEQQAAVYEQIAQEALSLAAGRNWQVEQLGLWPEPAPAWSPGRGWAGAILTPRRLLW